MRLPSSFSKTIISQYSIIKTMTQISTSQSLSLHLSLSLPCIPLSMSVSRSSIYLSFFFVQEYIITIVRFYNKNLPCKGKLQ